MPWQNTPDDRRRSDATYKDPVYLRNKAAAQRRAGGYCEDCRHRHPQLQCDHDTPVSQGGTHDLANLKMRCVGDGSCKCHERKTSQEGNAGRRRTHDPLPQPRTRW